MISFFIIDWGWFATAVATVCGLGGLWRTVLFPAAWARVFKVTPKTAVGGVGAMSIQVAATTVYGLILFILTQLEVTLSVFVLVCMVSCTIGVLNFRFDEAKTFFHAILLEVGYIIVASLIFIICGTL
ncbi:MAG: hypothetical protein LBF89_12715 [Bacteroidales bacterium]|jgi:hypothetical protein|nr:hypothetical protein [Bacteroidales bacterium]